MVDFASFKYTLSYAYDLPSSYIEIRIASVFDKFLRIQVLGIEGMITMGLVIIEKYKDKIDQEYFVRFGQQDRSITF